MRHIRLALLVCLLCLAVAVPAQAQSLPPCTPSQGGRLQSVDIEDTAAHSTTRFYATHRLRLKLFASNESPDEPDGTRYQVEGGTERLASAPGVAGPTTYVPPAAGARTLLVNWTVTKSKPFEGEQRFCTGTGSFPLTVRGASRTRFKVTRHLTDYQSSAQRITVSIARGTGDNLNPLDVRMRRGRGGRRRKLFTLPLADAADETIKRFSYRRRFAGVGVIAQRRNALFEARGLVTLGVKMPRVRAGRRVRRSFTLELARDGRRLLAIRAVISCRGLGRAPALQVCSTPVFKVRRR